MPDDKPEVVNAEKAEKPPEKVEEKSEESESWVSEAASSVWDTIKGWVGADDDEEKKEGEAKSPEAKVEAKEEPKKDGDGSIWEWITGSDFESFFTKAKNESKDSSAKAGANEFEVLSDGTKVAKDGSWIEFPEKAADNLDDKKGEPIEHKFKDKDGKDVTVTIKDGKVFHKSADGTETEVTDKRVRVKGSDGSETVVDKETRDIIRFDKEGHRIFSQNKDGERQVLLDDGTILKKTESGYTVTDKDGKPIRSADPKEVAFYDEGGQKLVIMETEKKAAEVARAKKDGLWHVDGDEAVRTLPDGTEVHVKKSDGSVRFVTKQGYEVVLGSDDTMRVKKKGEPDSAYKTVKTADLPEDLRKQLGKAFRSDSDEVDLGNGHRFHRRRRSMTAGGIEIRLGKEGPAVVVDITGKETTRDPKTDKVVTTDPKNPDKPPEVYDQKTDTVTARGITLTPGETKFENGDVVKKDGNVHFANGDKIDNSGNFTSHDGTTIDRFGNVETADGWSAYDSFGKARESKESEGHAAAVTSEAKSVADAVAGKVSAGNVNFGDIAKLQASLGDISALMPILMAQGNFDAVARLMAAQGHLEGVLSMALPRAQAAELAHRQGIHSPMLIQEMQNNIYGRTPEQTVKSVMEGHGMRPKAG